MMLNDLKNRLTTGWNLFRFIRLVMSVIIMVQAISSGEILFAVLGSILLFQAAFNYGCCGTDGCYVGYHHKGQKPEDRAEGITFDEVK